MDNILLIAHPLNGLLMVAMPVALAIYLTRRFKLDWRLWWIGAGTFILSQIGHIPFNSALTLLFERGLLPSPPESWQVPFNAVVLGLSAGLWEELSRYATFRWWARDARTWRKSVLLGAGHGGMEAIILGALVLVTFVSMLSLRNADLATVVPPEQLDIARMQVAEYWSYPWYLTILGAVERAMTIPVQIAFSVLVLQVFIRRQSYWLWLAVGWHALIDAAAVLAQHYWGNLAAEALIAGFCLISLGMIFALRKREPEPAPVPTPLDTPQESVNLPEPPPETPENLESSRYN